MENDKQKKKMKRMKAKKRSLTVLYALAYGLYAFLILAPGVPLIIRCVAMCSVSILLASKH